MGGGLVFIPPPLRKKISPSKLLWAKMTSELLFNSFNNNNNNNNTLIYIASACRMTSEALADSSSRATECLTEK